MEECSTIEARASVHVFEKVRPRCGDCPMFIRHDPYQWGSCEKGYCRDGKCYGFRNAADGCVLPPEFWKEVRGEVQG